MSEELCEICGSKTKLIWDEQFDTNYYLCSQCKFLFMDEQHIVTPEQEVEVYNQHDNNLENKGYVNMFEKFINENIKPYQDNLTTALDFGCGPGPVLAYLLGKMGFKVDIYDIYFFPEPVYQNKTYDLITSTEVFEHLENPLETTKLLRDHLADDGILAIMTLFHPGNSEDFNKWWYRRDPTHISFYQPDTFKVIADKLDMEILQIGHKNSLVMKKK